MEKGQVLANAFKKEAILVIPMTTIMLIEYYFILLNEFPYSARIFWKFLLFCRVSSLCWCTSYFARFLLIYCCISSDQQFAEGVILNLENMWDESDVRTPMICFLSMGSDPTASIEGLAKKLKVGTYCIFPS